MTKPFENKITKDEIQYGKQLLKKHSARVTLSSILGTVAYASWQHSPYFIPEPLFTLAHGLAFTGSFLNCFTFPVNLLAYKSSRAFFRMIGLGFKFLGKGTLEEKIESTNPLLAKCFDDLIPATSDPLLKRRFAVMHSLSQQDYETALRRALPFLASYEDMPERLKTTRGARLFRKTSKLFDIQITNKKNLQWHLHYGIIYLTMGASSFADQHLTAAATVPSEFQVQATCFLDYYRNLLSRMKSESKGIKAPDWKNTLGFLLQNQASVQPFQRLGESRHEVLEISGEGILRQIFVFKRDDTPEALQREHALEEKLYDLFAEEDLVAQPLAFFEHEGKHYLVLRRVDGDSLRAVIERKGDDILSEIIPSLHLFHERMASDYQKGNFHLAVKRDHHQFLSDKAFHRLKKEHLTLSLEAAVHSLADHLDTSELEPAHGDFHPDQILVSDIGKITILDPEYLHLSSRLTDYADLFEHHTLPLHDQRRLQLLAHLHGLQQTPSSFESFMSSYHAHSLARTFYMFGSLSAFAYGMEPAERERAQAHYARRIGHHLSELKTLSPRTSASLAAFIEVAD